LTFSIVALDPKTKALGVAVSTAVPAVGSVVPHVEAEIGAIATQAETSVLYGVDGLKLLKEGLSASATLEKMLLRDTHRERRQVTIIDIEGRAAAFTGKETIEWKGHLIREDHVVAGNMLTGGNVLQAMTEAFQLETGSLAQSLLKALKAGQEAGGDKRGRMSAALKVADRRWKSESRPLLDLRVDAHHDPIKELCRVYSVSRKYFQIPE